ncbi:hypothetical protein PENTCL1PPCAC_20592 [Pristionchus entomophagus]|uniref:EF-hand domain-containing protein n=1 Tax=Pristionchus entomophagus TaxID=358040 RepID=A0AAV5TWF4_9BILA|nr:hypothetical protein PENTCL1PPCAC_20592 [Pristionchus entomophagus]
MDKPENSDDSIEDRAEDQDEDEPVRHQQSDDEIAAAQLAQMRISAKTLDSKDKEEKPKSDVDQDGKVSSRYISEIVFTFALHKNIRKKVSLVVVLCKKCGDE